MTNRALSLAANVLDIAFGVMLVVEGIIGFFSFAGVPQVFAGIFVVVIGAAIVGLEFIEIPMIKELFQIYWFFVGRGVFYLFLSSVAGGPVGYSLAVFIVGCIVALFWFIARFLGLTHEDVQPITGKSAGTYRNLGDNNPNPNPNGAYVPPAGTA